MATVCIPQVTLEFYDKLKSVVVRFDQRHASTDGGAVLLKALDDRLHLTNQLAACLADRRDPDKIRHTLRDLLRHLRGPVVLLWDRGTIHRRKAVKQWITAHPRLRVEEFPTYAPELNPAEYVWAQADRALANSAPTDLAQLNGLLRYAVRRIRRAPPLLWSRIHASELPWAR